MCKVGKTIKGLIRLGRTTKVRMKAAEEGREINSGGQDNEYNHGNLEKN